MRVQNNMHIHTYTYIHTYICRFGGKIDNGMISVIRSDLWTHAINQRETFEMYNQKDDLVRKPIVYVCACVLAYIVAQH